MGKSGSVCSSSALVTGCSQPFKMLWLAVWRRDSPGKGALNPLRRPEFVSAPCVVTANLRACPIACAAMQLPRSTAASSTRLPPYQHVETHNIFLSCDDCFVMLKCSNSARHATVLCKFGFPGALHFDKQIDITTLGAAPRTVRCESNVRSSADTPRVSCCRGLRRRLG